MLFLILPHQGSCQQAWKQVSLSWNSITRGSRASISDRVLFVLFFLNSDIQGLRSCADVPCIFGVLTTENMEQVSPSAVHPAFILLENNTDTILCRPLIERVERLVTRELKLQWLRWARGRIPFLLSDSLSSDFTFRFCLLQIEMASLFKHQLDCILNSKQSAEDLISEIWWKLEYHHCSRWAFSMHTYWSRAKQVTQAYASHDSRYPMNQCHHEGCQSWRLLSYYCK